MIIDLPRFIASERGSWVELERSLAGLDKTAMQKLSLAEAKRFHFLYQKVSSDLARISTFAAEPELRRYLESLTAQAYAHIHEIRRPERSFLPLRWLTGEFPRVFRRRLRAFVLAVLITLGGVAFGAFAVALDPEAKEAVLPEMFANHLGDPSRRVAHEESATSDRLAGAHAQFASDLMVNNIKVSIFTFGLGMTYGVGTVLELFYNGVILGLVAADYVLAGQTLFLMGWLMPHGVIEIPAILVAGQAGLVLATALIGWGDRQSMRTRLRLIGPDLMTLIGGAAVMLVWAGVIESFLSQHHEPAIPYWAKITFGALELLALSAYLGGAGRGDPKEARE